MHMKPPVVFIATLGTSDLKVKLLREPPAGDGRVESTWGVLPGKKMRAVHEALLGQAIRYVIQWPDEEPPDRGSQQRDGRVRPLEVDWKDNQLVAPDGWRVGCENDTMVLVAAKLWRLVRDLEERAQVCGVLLFSTRRAQGEGEPIAAAPLLAAALMERFRLGTDSVRTVDLLVDDEVTSDDPDDLLHRRGVGRADDAIRTLRADFPDASAWLSVGGGMGEWKVPITASVQLHFGRFERGLESGAASTAPMRPSESLRLRGIVVARIEAGDLSGAGAVARECDRYAAERGWTAAVLALAEAAEGKLLAAPPEVPLLNALAAKTPRCLLLAFRAEAALRSNRLAEAIQWTYGFADALALDDAEEQFGALTEAGTSITFAFRDAASASHFAMTISPKPAATSSCNVVALRKAAVQRPSAKAFTESLSHPVTLPDGSEYKPKDIRNQSTHSRIDALVMRVAADVYVGADVWATAPGGGHHFLDAPKTKAALTSLSALDAAWRTDPTAAFEAITASVVSRVRHHRVHDGVGAPL